MKAPLTPNFVVIDDDAVSNIICEIFIKESAPAAEINCFTSPSEGLAYLKSICCTQKAQNTVLFLDINMPFINGWEVLEMLVDICAGNKPVLKTIYMFSSSVNPDDKTKSFNHPLVAAFIEKPLTSTKLRDVLCCFVKDQINA
jgi:two-component system chemotaxis response regulator CheY